MWTTNGWFISRLYTLPASSSDTRLCGDVAHREGEFQGRELEKSIGRSITWLLTSLSGKLVTINVRRLEEGGGVIVCNTGVVPCYLVQPLETLDHDVRKTMTTSLQHSN
ncbi:hypothetical protein BgiMline_008256 [Biomphalaria glabrata]|nr:hypothetical protein BgiMline_018827 [Biomphalaria glabrata]